MLESVIGSRRSTNEGLPLLLPQNRHNSSQPPDPPQLYPQIELQTGTFHAF